MFPGRLDEFEISFGEIVVIQGASLDLFGLDVACPTKIGQLVVCEAVYLLQDFSGISTPI